MIVSRPPALAAAILLAVCLTGCSNDTPAQPASSPPTTSASTTTPPPASASPSPASTLTAAEQQAVDEAADVVLAYEQMFYDLLSDPDPYINDLNTVAAQPQLRIDLRNIQRYIVEGKVTVESAGPVSLASVEPVKVKLKGDPPTVTLLVCVDHTATRGTDDGKPWTGVRTQSQYRVIKTDYLPDPGWAVAQVLPPKGEEQPQPC